MFFIASLLAFQAIKIKIAEAKDYNINISINQIGKFMGLEFR
jgi:hypothetical protein